MNAPFNVDQLSLVAAISTELSNQNPSLTLEPRIFNKVISAANEIIKECGRSVAMPYVGMTVVEWFKCDDTGSSSKYMAYVMDGGQSPLPAQAYSYPRDIDDFGRCVRMVKALNWTERVPNLIDKGPEWAYIVRNWKHMVFLYERKENNDLSFMLKLARSDKPTSFDS